MFRTNLGDHRPSVTGQALQRLLPMADIHAYIVMAEVLPDLAPRVQAYCPAGSLAIVSVNCYKRTPPKTYGIIQKHGQHC